MKQPKPCDHVRHQWRGVDLPCAVPECVEGTPFDDLRVPYMRKVGTSEPTVTIGLRIVFYRDAVDLLIRENILGWSWRLA